jgi:hypothetical protein
MFNALIPGGKVRDWVLWDETTEAGFASDNRFVTIFNGGASANETGSGGGLSGADLVWTQVGGVPAVSSGYRQLNGSSQYFTATANAMETMLTSQSSWMVAMRIKTHSTIDQTSIYLELYQSNETYIGLKNYNTAQFYVAMYDNDANAAGQENEQTANDMSSSTEYYLFTGCNGSSVKMGFYPVSSGKPVGFGHIAAGDQCVWSALFDNMGSIDTRRHLGTDTAAYGQFGIQWVVVASEAFIAW